MTARTALRIEVRGVRAGAAFASAVAERARTAGVMGWVRSDADGAVRLHAEGDQSALTELTAFLAGARSGAPAAVADSRPVRVEGHEQFAVRGVAAGAFAVREHESGFHLCLEVDGAIRGWTLRRSPSMDPGVRRMAIEIAGEELNPGGTEWDGGPYEQGGRVAWPEALERGHAVFVLHGSTLRGGFALQRTRGGGPGAQWLIVKRRDGYAA